MRTQFGRFMRMARQEQGLSTEGLAHLVGCDKLMIESVEKNVRPIPGRLLVPWANALKMTCEQIILIYLNDQARTICLEAGIAPRFKVVESEWAWDKESIPITGGPYGMDRSI